jgi:fumarylacetoacetate (FAA) hydrolase family protein
MESLLTRCLPEDADSAILVGRVWTPAVRGPTLVQVKPDGVYDLSPIAATVSQLLELQNPLDAVCGAPALRKVGSLVDVLSESAYDKRTGRAPWLLAPCDLQAIKASGVTFASSLLERVIEEQARGDASKAESIRESIVATIGGGLSNIRAGSAEAMQLKEVLIGQGVWSQYLEVGIGPDVELFTKSQPLSSVGTGAEVGIHPESKWNNPEPEIVLAITSKGQAIGATLGNDVNLRDFEGRSALLLGKAKDNNASCAIGPFIRLFDASFTLDDVRHCEVALNVEGPEGYRLSERSRMAMISRDPLDIVEQAIGPFHQYPDGMLLFLGTMFAPTDDRFSPGQGFTHVVGDIVTVATPKLGALINRVNHADKIAPWTFGIAALMENLAGRRLL